MGILLRKKGMRPSGNLEIVVVIDTRTILTDIDIEPSAQNNAENVTTSPPIDNPWPPSARFRLFS